MYAYQLLPHRFNQQCGHNGRIHAAGQGQQHFFISNLLAQFRNLFFNKCFCQFACRNPFHRFRTFCLFHT